MSWGAILGAAGSVVSGLIDANTASSTNRANQQAFDQLQQILNDAQAKEEAFLSQGNAEAAAMIREAAAQQIAGFGEMMGAIPGMKEEMLNLSQQFYNEASELYAPFRADKAGANNAFNLQLGMLGLPNIDGSVNAFNPDNITNNPSFQFMEEQGNKGVDRSAAARTGTLGGGAVRESQRFANGLASQEWNNEFARAGSVGNALNQSALAGTAGTASALSQSYSGVMSAYSNLNNSMLAAMQGKSMAGAGASEALGALAMNNASNRIQLSQNNTASQANILSGRANSSNAARGAKSDAWKGAVSAGARLGGSIFG